MTGLELIVAALAAGAGAGVKDTASVAVKDAYATFKQLLARRLAGRPTAYEGLEAEETAPEVWQASLGQDLTATGAVTDQEILTAATRLLGLVDPAGHRAGTYTVTVGTNYGAAGHFNAPVTITNNPPPPTARP
jgi:hypothetical protein